MKNISIRETHSKISYKVRLIRQTWLQILHSYLLADFGRLLSLSVSLCEIRTFLTQTPLVTVTFKQDDVGSPEAKPLFFVLFVLFTHQKRRCYDLKYSASKK